jgi:hypothetical protein
MVKPWVCIDCGARQDDKGACAACAHEDTLDARDERVRDLMRDVDMRLTDRREGRLRFLGVGIGMAIVFALWMVPGYWSLRGKVYPGLPLFADQWMLMALIAFGVLKGGEKLFFKKRFPYLQSDMTMT